MLMIRFSYSINDWGGSKGVNFVVSSQVVGWPPVGSHRMNSLVNHQAGKAAKAEGEEVKTKKKNDEPKDVSVHGSGFVKVNKDGVGIGRKVDMRAHSSYENLARTLEEMFFGMAGQYTAYTNNLFDNGVGIEILYFENGQVLLLGKR